MQTGSGNVQDSLFGFLSVCGNDRERPICVQRKEGAQSIVFRIHYAHGGNFAFDQCKTGNLFCIVWTVGFPVYRIVNIEDILFRFVLCSGCLLIGSGLFLDANQNRCGRLLDGRFLIYSFFIRRGFAGRLFCIVCSRIRIRFSILSGIGSGWIGIGRVVVLLSNRCFLGSNFFRSVFDYDKFELFVERVMRRLFCSRFFILVGCAGFSSFFAEEGFSSFLTGTAFASCRSFVISYCLP